MLKVAVLSCLILMLSGSVLADGFMGLYADGSSPDPWKSCANGVGIYPVEIWIWSLPSQKGIIAAQFAISYPYNVIPATAYSNQEIISFILGDLNSGIGVGYINCQHDWHWSFHQTLYVTDPVPTHIAIVPHPDVGYCFTNCAPDYSTESFIVHTVFKINQECPPENPVSTEGASWGTIKSMYRN